MSGPAYYPKAEQRITGDNGGTYIGGPPRGVWHETITAPSAFFESETFYHIQFRQWPLTDRPRIAQYIPFTVASRALRNLGPGRNPTGDPDVQTNRMGQVNINAALVGYQTARSNGYPSLYPLTDAMVNEIGEWTVWCEKEWGIPADLDALISEAGQQEYGYLSPLRFSADEWEDFTGWCGHERVTENTHHDPYYLFGRQAKTDIAQLIGGEMIDRNTDLGGSEALEGEFEQAQKDGWFTEHTKPGHIVTADKLAAFINRHTRRVTKQMIAAAVAGAVGGNADRADEIIRQIGSILSGS